MSHAVFPGVVVAYIVGILFAIGAFVAGLFCAIATGYLDDNSRIKRDTIMGIVFSGMFGAGLVLYVAIQSEVHLDHILFGDMLGFPPAILGKRRRLPGDCADYRAKVARLSATRLRSASG